MLLSRKRSREPSHPSLPPLAMALPLARPHIDEKSLLRDLLDADGRAVAFLQRHNQRQSSQELFLSVVLEWQRDDRSHAWSSSSSESSDSEAEDAQPQRPSIKFVDDESPTRYVAFSIQHIAWIHFELTGRIVCDSVQDLPRAPTPLHLDQVASAEQTEKKIGIYSPRARRELLRKYMAKRAKRLSQRTVRYRVRKTLANARPRVKGRFVKTQQPLTAALVEAMGVSDDAEHADGRAD